MDGFISIQALKHGCMNPIVDSGPLHLESPACVFSRLCNYNGLREKEFSSILVWIPVIVFAFFPLIDFGLPLYSKWQAVVTIYNFQQYRHIQAPGWTLGWTWAKKEVIWSMTGSQTTEQGDCSRFKGNIPHCCKKDPTVVDLLPGTPYNQQYTNCCKGGVISSWVQDPANAASSFLLVVGSAGTSNRTVRMPKNYTLRVPGPGYTCGPGKIVRPSKFLTADKRRVTQALSKLAKLLQGIIR